MIFTTNPPTCAIKIKDILEHEIFDDFLEHYPYLTENDIVPFKELVEFLIREKLYSLKRDETLFTNFLTFLKKINPDIPSFSIQELDVKQHEIYSIEIKNL
jgi:hypothetical protein